VSELTPIRIRLGIVGFGKIARDQHVPALAASTRFALAGIASPLGGLAGVPAHDNLAALLDAEPTLEAVAICTPPQARYEVALFALSRGLHVILEKPPCVTLGEAQVLVDLARRQNVALFTAWHSRYAPAVEPAREWAASHPLRAVRIVWKEDVRVWHPGQAWIWQAGGLGVFDPGINALSMLTRILHETVVVRSALLRVPSNCETPIAAHLALRTASGVPVDVDLDFLHVGPPQWDIDLDSDTGSCSLSMGGGQLIENGTRIELPPSTEYPALYSRFAHLIAERAVDSDLTPLSLVADAFLCAQRVEIEPFLE
jgi:D-galactose 1-dehydrogenase